MSMKTLISMADSAATTQALFTDELPLAERIDTASHLQSPFESHHETPRWTAARTVIDGYHRHRILGVLLSRIWKVWLEASGGLCTGEQAGERKCDCANSWLSRNPCAAAVCFLDQFVCIGVLIPEGGLSYPFHASHHHPSHPEHHQTQERLGKYRILYATRLAYRFLAQTALPACANQVRTSSIVDT
jgi:hypothetical protein